jgi:hypothetical protein
MNIKKVKVLFSYTESIVPPRCRKARDQRFHDGEMVVDVREVSPEEAPVALIQTNHDFGGKPLGTAEYRWFEDQLWVNQRVEFRFGESNDKPLGDFIDARDDGANRIHGAGRHATKREVIERFQSEASSYVLIQGERWEPAGEPRYYVDDSSTYGTYVKVAHSFQRHSQRERYFSLKQYADAKALADRMNRERERPEVDATPNDRFQILISDALRVNEQEQVEITVFGLRDAAFSSDKKRAEHHLLEVRIRVPKDVVESRDHLEVASRRMHELHDRFPEAVFDEHSPAGRVIMGMREQIEALLGEKASRFSGESEASHQDLDI